MLNKINNASSIISNDLDIKGDLVSLGIIDIEGKVTGKIKSNEVTIRESGFVEGEIKAEILNIKGNFKGDIIAKKLNISGKAKIYATISYETLCVEDGALIEGEIKRVDEKNFDRANIEKIEKKEPISEKKEVTKK